MGIVRPNSIGTLMTPAELAYQAQFDDLVITMNQVANNDALHALLREASWPVVDAFRQAGFTIGEPLIRITTMASLERRVGLEVVVADKVSDVAMRVVERLDWSLELLQDKILTGRDLAIRWKLHRSLALQKVEDPSGKVQPMLTNYPHHAVTAPMDVAECTVERLLDTEKTQYSDIIREQVRDHALQFVEKLVASLEP